MAGQHLTGSRRRRRQPAYIYPRRRWQHSGVAGRVAGGGGRFRIPWPAGDPLAGPARTHGGPDCTVTPGDRPSRQRGTRRERSAAPADARARYAPPASSHLTRRPGAGRSAVRCGGAARITASRGDVLRAYRAQVGPESVAIGGAPPPPTNRRRAPYLTATLLP